MAQAYATALHDTKICMQAVTSENLLRCWTSLQALQSACLRGNAPLEITSMYGQILQKGLPVVEAHCSLMGIRFAQVHEDVVASLTFGVGHRTLCQKAFEQDPWLSYTCCATELCCLTGPLPPIVDDSSDSEAVSQSPDMISEAPIKRTAHGLDSFCVSEEYQYRTARAGGHISMDDVQASQTAFTQMCSGLQDALTSYANRHPRRQNIALQNLSFARDSNASLDATQIFDHRDLAITERALLAAQMMKSIAATVGPTLDSQYREARRRLQLARGAYHEITDR